MTKPITAVLADALRLDDDTRAELAAELLPSLDGPGEPEAEQAWDAEIERRIEAIDAGQITLEPWAEDALEAIHDFLRYQIVEHKTGDPLTPQK